MEALVSLASSLRNGIGCIIPARDDGPEGTLNIEKVSCQMGGQNCHLDILFEDGVVWLARIRLDDPLLPPKPTQSYIALSEVSTLRYLETVAIPSPEVYYFASDCCENPVGVTFVLMQKMHGKPLDWVLATSAQRSKILEQLADIFLELEKHPFQQAGSLVASSSSGPSISGYAQVALFDTPETPLGPFSNLESAADAMLTQQLRLIARGELSSLAVDNYLSHCWRKELIHRVLSKNNDSGFFLKHYDDKGDHILVDEDFNITGIIDWEFASTEPKALAFSSPCMLWPVGDFYAGSNKLAPEEVEFALIFERRGREDLANIVRSGRKMQRYFFFNGGGVSREQNEFEALFQGLRASWAESGQVLGSYAVWRDRALERYRGDVRLQNML